MLTFLQENNAPQDTLQLISWSGMRVWWPGAPAVHEPNNNNQPLVFPLQYAAASVTRQRAHLMQYKLC